VWWLQQTGENMNKKTRKIKLRASILVIGFTLVQTLALASPVGAAPQQAPLGGTGSGVNLTFDDNDDPLLNDDPTTTATYGGLGINSGSEGTPEQTSADSGTNLRYTWRMPSLRDQLPLCSNAQLTSLRVVADVTATSEGDPDLVTLAVYRIDGANMYALGDYTISQGYDVAPTTAFVTPPNGLGVYAVGRGTPAQLGGQIAGTIEASWDLSSFDIDDQFGIMVQQDTEDGSTDVQTTIQTVELTYDDENCVVDGAITKTLLNPTTVAPGGQAMFEVTVTNNGTDPLPFNAQEDRGIFDIFSPSLELVSTESDDVDVECQDFGMLIEAFAGGDPGQSIPYQNHLDYRLALCTSQSSALIPVGETWSFTTTFNVSPDAEGFTNFLSWALVFEPLADPGLVPFIEIINELIEGGDDIIDVALRGDIVSDNVAFVEYVFPVSSVTPTPTENNLASSGTGIVYGGFALIVLGVGVVSVRRYATYTAH
jgi:hypothetical protein